MTIVTSVPTRLVREVWERGAARWIDGALRVEPIPTHTTDDVLNELLAEKGALWIACDPDNRDDPIDAAIVSMVQVYPQVRVYYMPWCGGRKLWSWVHEFNRLTDEAARQHGCTVKKIGGREGWLRFGYRKTGIMMMREISP